MYKWIIHAANGEEKVTNLAKERIPSFKRPSRFPIVSFTSQKRPSLITVAIAKKQSENPYGVTFIVESFTTNVLTFYTPFKVVSMLQARLQILREFLLRITQQEIQEIYLQTRDKA